MNENEYQDAINCLTQELADFKAEVSAKLAEMADRTKDVLEGYDERIKGHVDFTAEVVEKVEKNFVRGNEIILEELRNLENKLLAKIEGREK